MIKIYIASPYTKGDVAVNVHQSIRLADYISTYFNVHVKCPLLTHFWHMLYPQAYSFWLAYDLVELEECNALVRMMGASDGADKEVLHATQLGLPVHFFKGFDEEGSVDALDNFINSLGK